MAHVILENCRFGFPGHVIVDGVNWRIDDASQVGLVGPNGAGKTTLFRLIAGEIEPDSGGISRSKDLRLGFLRQGFEIEAGQALEAVMVAQFADLLAVGEEMRQVEKRLATADDEQLLQRYGQLQAEWERRDGYTYRERIRRVLMGLGFQENDFSREIASFSGGERNRAALAGQLLGDPELLLLDEPTNHLDIQATEWLESYLADFNGGFVVISHDRYFLDRVCREIIEIENASIEVYSGNYSKYVTERERRREQRRKQFERQREYIAKTEDFIRRNIAGQKTKQAQSRRKMLEKLDRVTGPASDHREMGLRFRVEQPGSRIPIETRGLSRKFGDQWIIREVDVRVERGEKIGVIGANGSGKSTLLRMLAARLAPSSGELLLGRQIHIGYYDQHLRDLSAGNTVMDEIWRQYPDLTKEQVRSFLGRFLFPGDDVFKLVRDLSGGESARLSLAKLMLAGANLLLLDEPTNHLDIRSREVLENALKDYESTLIMVTHDRYLLDAVVDKIWSVEDLHLREYWGNYTYFQRKRQEEAEWTESAGKRVEDPGGGRRLSKKELRRARAEARKDSGPSAKALEELVYQLEDEIHAVQVTMARPEYASDWQKLAELSGQEKTLSRRLEDTIKQWEDALEREAAWEESIDPG